MELKAYAKINLDLYVKEANFDGYHDIDSIFAKIDLFDLIDIEIKESNNTEINIECDNIKEEDNIIYKVIRKYFSLYKINAVVNCKVTKYIPVRAGLGGGSSDGATVLLYLNKYFKKCSKQEMFDLAYNISSDMLFFLENCNSAIVTNYGKTINPITLPPLYCSLILGKFNKLSTKIAYSKLDELGLNFISRERDMLVKPLTQWNLHNDFSKLYPMTKIVESYDKNKFKVILSGSGSAIILLFERSEILDQNTNFSVIKLLR